MVDIAVFYVSDPLKVIDIVYLLNEHSDAFNAIREFGWDHIHIQ